MALKATIFKAELTVSDTDRGYYASHALTIARHPSETDERMMVRLLAFALNASDSLQFTKGLSTENEPDIWQKSLSDEIELWIDVGLPDEKIIRKACGRSRQVAVYAYGGRSVALWWAGIETQLARFSNLRIMELPKDTTDALAAMAERTMHITCMINDGSIWFSNGSTDITIEPVMLYGGSHA